jgi:hypothetical protein
MGAGVGEVTFNVCTLNISVNENFGSICSNASRYSGGMQSFNSVKRDGGFPTIIPAPADDHLFTQLRHQHQPHFHTLFYFLKLKAI